MNELQEWQLIAFYNAGKADLVSTILEHFESKLNPDVAQWLRVDREVSLENKLAAEQSSESLR